MCESSSQTAGAVRVRKAARIAAVAAALCIGAAVGDSRAQGDEQVLRERVASFWDARLERSLKVYDFYPSPDLGGPKDRTTIGELGDLSIHSYSIEAIEVNGDESASIRLKVGLGVPLAMPGGTRDARRSLLMLEDWNKICGTWYRKPRPFSLARQEFDPSMLGSVGEGGPDCKKVASDEDASTTVADADKEESP